MLALSLLLGLLSPCYGLDNGLAKTPPMGWYLWHDSTCNETSVKGVADMLVNDGYLEAGYKYLNIANCWQTETRGPDNRPGVNTNKFPLGMKDIADYLHRNGLKFGLNFGSPHCYNYRQNMDFIKLTVKTFKEWEVDYIKQGGCLGLSREKIQEGYKYFGRLLKATGRPMLYGCVLPAFLEEEHSKPNYTLIAETCNTWHVWDHGPKDMWSHIKYFMKWYGDHQNRLAKFAGPGHWNDPGRLTVGNRGVSVDQAKVQMAVWAIMAAPLVFTSRKPVKYEFKKILQNKDVISVNQDPLGKQGLRILKYSQMEVWKRELHDGSFAIAIVNHRMGRIPYKASFTRQQLQLPAGGFLVTDLYHEDKPTTWNEPTFKMTIKPTGVRFYKFKAQ